MRAEAERICRAADIALRQLDQSVDAAANFGLTVVAEGIETADQQQALVARGCELGQGFLLSKPLPPFAIGDILRPDLRVV